MLRLGSKFCSRHLSSRKIIKRNKAAKNLQNNLSLITDSSIGTCTPHSVSVGVVLAAGSKYDTKSGESALFSRTLITPEAKAQLDALGASILVDQTREEVSLIARCLEQDAEKVMSILAQSLARETEENHFESAKQSHLQFIDARSEVIDDEYLLGQAHTIAYQGLPLGKSVLGFEDTVSSLTVQDINKFRSSNVNNGSAVLTAVGLSEANLEAMANKYFGNLFTNKNEIDNTVDFIGSEAKITDEEHSALELFIGFQGPSVSHRHYFTSIVVQNLLGFADRTKIGNTDFPISKLAEASVVNDYVSKLSSYNFNYSNNGMFGVLATVDPKEAHGGYLYIKTLMSELRGFANVPVFEVDLQRAKNFAKGRYLENNVDSLYQAKTAGTSALHTGSFYTAEEFAKGIESVSAKDIKDFAREYVIDCDPVVTAYGITHSLIEYYWTRSLTK